MQRCPNCGHPASQVYCGQCGTRVQPATPSAAPTATAVEDPEMTVLRTPAATATTAREHSPRRLSWEQQPSVQPNPQPASGTRASIACPQCGQGTVALGGRCPRCGYRSSLGHVRTSRPAPPSATASAPVRAPQPAAPGPAHLPAITTTVLITLFFGLFGLIPASMHSQQALALGTPTNRYWKAFGFSLAAAIAFWILVYVIIVAAMVNAIDSYPY